MLVNLSISFCLGFSLGVTFAYTVYRKTNQRLKKSDEESIEYYAIYGKHGDDINQALDKYGDEGWEAFAVVPDGSGIVIYLKRKKI